MLKTCFVCGAKEKKLFNSMCEKCFKEKYPPVEELKPMNLKLCNMCRKIHYKNALYTLEEFYELLPRIIKKKFKLNDYYTLNAISIENYSTEAENLVFDVRVDCDLK